MEPAVHDAFTGAPWSCTLVTPLARSLHSFYIPACMKNGYKDSKHFPHVDLPSERLQDGWRKVRKKEDSLRTEGVQSGMERSMRCYIES